MDINAEKNVIPISINTTINLVYIYLYFIRKERRHIMLSLNAIWKSANTICYISYVCQKLSYCLSLLLFLSSVQISCLCYCFLCETQNSLSLFATVIFVCPSFVRWLLSFRGHETEEGQVTGTVDIPLWKTTLQALNFYFHNNIWCISLIRNNLRVKNRAYGLNGAMERRGDCVMPCSIRWKTEDIQPKAGDEREFNKKLLQG